jgi:hypothetical protein
VRLPCGSYKPLVLKHLCIEFCILRSSLFLSRLGASNGSGEKKVVSQNEPRNLLR